MGRQCEKLKIANVGKQKKRNLLSNAAAPVLPAADRNFDPAMG